MTRGGRNKGGISNNFDNQKGWSVMASCATCPCSTAHFYNCLQWLWQGGGSDPDGTELKTPFQTQITFCDNSGTVSPYHTVQCSSSGTRHLCAREGSKPELHSSPYSYYWSDCWFPHKASLRTVVHLLFQTNLRCLTSLCLLNHLEFEGTSLGCRKLSG